MKLSNLLILFVFLLFVLGPGIYKYLKSQQGSILLASLAAKFFSKLNFTTNIVVSERSKEAIIALEQRDLPAYVYQRAAEQNQGNLPWASDLSVNDWLLLKKYKFRPLGMVMGAAHYHLAFSQKNYINSQNYQASYSYSQSSRELAELTQGIRKTVDLAIARLLAEAELLDAHAVVNLQIKANLPSENSHQVEYVFFGTAIALDNMPKPKVPVVCSTSVTDFVKLMQAGSMPVGLGVGIGIYYNASGYFDQLKSQSWSNQEIQNYSEAVNNVRLLAIWHLREDINKYQGDGILTSYSSFQVEPIEVEGNNGHKDHLLQFFCLGTVISNQSYHSLSNFRTALDLTK